jgi:hypothetical protein
MALIRNLFWIAIFIASTFLFTVLFEHGPTDFVQNAKKEADVLKQMMGAKPERRKDDSDKLTPSTVK